ncbi:hypothetical protein GCM10009839_45440 [Catenulispora yoronensis]|uniref:Uncharacterized protein n=1 Tax=Catenulispora yoronensis TaxID=450799 RepID=A0ABN2UL03_9ACTN
MTESRLRAHIEVRPWPDAQADQEEAHDLALSLRQELLGATEVDNAVLAPSDAVPEHAKSGAALSTAAVLVTLGPTLVRPMLHAIETWLQHRPARNVSVRVGDLTLEVTGATGQQQQQAIDAFIAALERNGGGDSDGESPALPGSGSSSSSSSSSSS